MRQFEKSKAIELIEKASKKANKYACLLCNGWHYEKNIMTNDFDVEDEARWTADIAGKLAYCIDYAKQLAEYTDLSLKIQTDPRGEIITIESEEVEA